MAQVKKFFARMVFACNMENPPIHNPSLARLHLANTHVPVHVLTTSQFDFIFELVLDAYDMCVTSGMLDHVN